MSEHIKYMKHVISCSLSEVKKEMVAYQRRKFNIFQESIKPHIYGLRLETVHVCGENMYYRRVFIKCEDSGEYAKVGWILNEDCAHCMICRKSLSLRHHCRACGNILCSSCCDIFEYVDLIESLGPVRVCMLCYYGQSPVEAKLNCLEGMKLFGNFEHEVDEDSNAVSSMNSNISSLINLYEFGELEYHSIVSMFLIQSSMRQTRQRIYMHICSSDSIPFNADNILVGEEKLIYFAINAPRLPGKPIGTSTNSIIGNEKSKKNGASVDNSGKNSATLEYLIYEVVVHPNVIEEIKLDSQNLMQLCEQVMLSLPLITPQVGVENYQLITSTEKKLKVLRLIKGKSDEDENLDREESNDSIPPMKMLLPPKRCFFELYHVYVSENYYTNYANYLAGNLSGKNSFDSESIKRQREEVYTKYRKQIKDIFSQNPRKSSHAVTSSKKSPKSVDSNQPKIQLNLPTTQDVHILTVPQQPADMSVSNTVNVIPVIENPNSTLGRHENKQQQEALSNEILPTHPEFLTRIVDISPSPGFVIKTRRIFQVQPTLPPDHPLSALNSPAVNSDEKHSKYIVSASSILDPDYKVFINVYYHPVVKDILKNEIPKESKPQDNFLLLIHNKIENVYDKDRQLSDLYHVVVSSDYFVKAFVSNTKHSTNSGEGKLITDQYFIEKILEALNHRFEDNLDSVHYSLPRVKGGQKGERISGNTTMQFEYMIPNPIHTDPSILPPAGVEQKKRRFSLGKSILGTVTAIIPRSSITSHNSSEHLQDGVDNQERNSENENRSRRPSISQMIFGNNSPVSTHEPRNSISRSPSPLQLGLSPPKIENPTQIGVTINNTKSSPLTESPNAQIYSSSSPSAIQTPAVVKSTAIAMVEEDHQFMHEGKSTIPSVSYSSANRLPPSITQPIKMEHSLPPPVPRHRTPSPSPTTSQITVSPKLPVQTSANVVGNDKGDTDEQEVNDNDDDNDRHSDVSDVSLATSIASSTVSYLPAPVNPMLSSHANTRNVLPFTPSNPSAAGSEVGMNHTVAAEKHKLKAHRHSIFQMLYPKTTITTMTTTHQHNASMHHPLERPPDASYYPQPSPSDVDTTHSQPKTVSVVLPEKGEGGEEMIRIPLEISPEMVHYDVGEMIDWRDAAALKQQSITQPAVLLGWQIMLYDKLQNTEIYVVTGIRKNALRKSEFQLRNCVDDEPVWTKLKRSEKKSGRFFRPLRKVVYLDTDTGDDGSGAGGTWTSSFAARDSESTTQPPTRSVLFDEQQTTATSSMGDNASIASSSNSSNIATSSVAAAKNFFGALRRGSTGGIGLNRGSKGTASGPLTTTSSGITKVSTNKPPSTTTNNNPPDQKTAWEEEQWLRNTIEQQQASSFVHHLANTKGNVAPANLTTDQK